ncbi:methyltransferase domain-containing protein [Leptospira levettii]|uniref:methyltransferase domain-containing protein n=1 Tax=Leptospira levettii TaxID=2023178 RepID=UPI001EEB3129|nr:methyltransferase domain-containing protein [Leptospira levettii]MCG6150279.1 methyltransferase domain-containing protein [Leptospira levettii]
MDKQTIDAYDRLTDEYFVRQERFTHRYLSELEFLLKDNPLSETNVLDIGCGTGKFIEHFNNLGLKATGIEPSTKMIEQVAKRYPNRSTWIQMGSLPRIPSFSDSFDMVSALAVLQHVPRSELFLSLFNIKQIIKPKGYFVFSLPLKRNDLNEDARDKEGRLHYPYNMNEICLLLEQLGFQFVKEFNLPDEECRGWFWSFCIMRLIHEKSVPLDRIDSILSRERKTATYKPALLRALCDIALENQNLVLYESNRVYIPIRLIAEKWILYFWNLFSAPIYLPQVTSDKEEAPSRLRQTFHSIQSKLMTLDDYLDKEALLHSEKLIDLELQKEMNLFLNLWEQTIIKGPIKYSSDGELFQFDPKRQLVSLPIPIWKEFVLLESWIRDAVILRWAEEIERISKNSVRTGQAIDYLMMGQNRERKQGQLREFFLEQSDLSCIWTGKSLHSGNLDVDHGIPYSYWKNNFLWNLFPTDAKTNRLKSEKIPSANLLSKRELQIREHWNKLSQSKPNQFTFEIKNYLGKYYQAKDWDVTLFAMYQETAETLASRRGVMQWEGV